MNIKNKRLVIVGLGESGLAAARLGCFLGANVTVTDRRPLHEFSEKLEEFSGLKVFASGHPAAAFENCDLVVISPGVPTGIPELDPVRKRNIPIISEVELACRYIEQPIIAVTGTNGKSTTTTLIAKILKDQNCKVFVGANLGKPVSLGVLKMLREGDTPDYWVLEMSSFQLETISSFHPHIGLFLNLSEDHLDRYQSINDYRDAKMRLFMNQDFHNYAIYNDDDPASNSIPSKAGRIPFSRTRILANGCWIESDTVHYAIGSLRGTLGKTGDFGIKGLHNLENILAAAAAAVTCHAEPNRIYRSLCEFTGLEHRMEFAGKVNGVLFINDSKATNLDSVKKSLMSFEQPVILIAGGRSKQSCFQELAPYIKKKVRLLLLIGEAARQIKEDLENSGMEEAVETKMADSLSEAVAFGYRSARPEEVILLSPGCASFDAFKNFEDRGNQFKTAVSRLAEQYD